MENLILPKYPSLERIANLYPGPQVLLGHYIYWTEKRDGTQLRCAWVDGQLLVSTSHMEQASADFRSRFDGTEQAEKVIQLLKEHNGEPENPINDFNCGLVVFGELLCKGKSPARFETHETNEFVIFDMYSLKGKEFLPYPLAYQYAFHFRLPFVDCWALTRHTSLEDLYAFRDEILKTAADRHREGVVLKCLSGDKPVYAKEKLDLPTIPRVERQEGAVRLPSLPDSEVYGAIAKVEADVGEDFDNKAVAMPLIAKYVAEEMDKHMCGKPAGGNLFQYYTKYREGASEAVERRDDT